ncbi:MAG: hypothetical protein KA144_00525 [Xanthomonadaceae bacterium]|nr:hypothetical protein [Xanthomonadaceae bacterium]
MKIALTTMLWRASLASALLSCALCAAAENPFSNFDDPRPEGRLSLRERSHCEVPDDPQARWCDYPHEIRAFTERRETCDHFRGESWPDGDEPWAIERREQLIKGMRDGCTGTDAELARLRAKYRDDAELAKLLGEFETSVEP